MKGLIIQGPAVHAYSTNKNTKIKWYVKIPSDKFFKNRG